LPASRKSKGKLSKGASSAMEKKKKKKTGAGPFRKNLRGEGEDLPWTSNTISTAPPDIGLSPYVEHRLARMDGNWSGRKKEQGVAGGRARTEAKLLPGPQAWGQRLEKVESSGVGGKKKSSSKVPVAER